MTCNFRNDNSYGVRFFLYPCVLHFSWIKFGSHPKNKCPPPQPRHTDTPPHIHTTSRTSIYPAFTTLNVLSNALLSARIVSYRRETSGACCAFVTAHLQQNGFLQREVCFAQHQCATKHVALFLRVRAGQ